MSRLLDFLTLAVLLGPGNTTSAPQPTLLRGVLGESVTLPLMTPAEPGALFISWLYNGTHIVFINLKEGRVDVADLVRKDRLSVTPSYGLQIRNLTAADAGHYCSQTMTASSPSRHDYHLSIFRRLRNLHVTSATRLSANGTCEVRLACSTEAPADQVSFRWQGSGPALTESANLTVSWDPENTTEQNYSCVAENPVSHTVSPVSVQSLCRAVFNERRWHLKTLWMWSAVAAACVAAMAVSFCVCRASTGSSGFSPQQPQSPVGTLRSRESDSLSAGSTVYTQVMHASARTESSTPMRSQESSTIYCTVTSPSTKPGSPSATALSHVI